MFGHNDFGGVEGQGLSQVEIGVVHESSENPEEGLLILIVTLGRNIIILQVSLSVECDLTSFNLSILTVDLVANEHHGDVVTNSGQILVPFGDIFIGNTGSNIEHDDSGMGTDVISFSETSELLLTGGVPDVKLDGTVVGEKYNIGHFNTLGGDILLFELTSQMSLDEGGLSDTAISNEHELVLGDDLSLRGINHFFLVNMLCV